MRFKDGSASISIHQLELSYSLLYLRAFLYWENFLEEMMIRLLCGYLGPNGQEPLRAGDYYKVLSAARLALLGGKPYRLWHNVDAVVARFDIFFSNAASPYRTALVATPQLKDYSAIRHRIAHDQEHGRSEFDVATMHLVAKRIRGSQPGKFLREVVVPGVDTRWLGKILADVARIADQMN